MSVCRCSLWDEQQHSAVRCGWRALGSFHSTGRSGTQPAEFRVTSPWFWRAWISSFFSLEAVLSYAMCNYSVLSFIIELSEGQLPFLMNGFFFVSSAGWYSVLVREQESSFTPSRADSFMPLDRHFTFKQLLWNKGQRWRQCFLLFNKNIFMLSCSQ